MAQETYKFEIVAEIQKATAAVDKFASGTQKQLDSIKFTSTINAISAGLNIATRAVSALASALQAPINEAIEAERAVTSLANSMRIVGDFSSQAIENFKTLADEIQRTTSISDDQVISAAALAKSYGLTNKEAQNVIRASIELATVTGDDLNTSVEKLSKSYNGLIDKSLKSLIPELRTLTDEQKASGEAVRIVAERYGGSANDAVKTFGGSISQLGNSVSNTTKELGNLLIQIGLIQKGIEGTKEVSNGLGNLFKSLAESFRTGEPLKPAQGSIQEQLNLLRESNKDGAELLDEIKRGARSGSSIKFEVDKEKSIKSARDALIAQEKALESFNSIKSKIELSGLSDIEKINKSAYDNIAIVRSAIDTGAIKKTIENQNLIRKIEVERIKAISELEKKELDKRLAEEKKAREDALAKTKDIFANPIANLAQGNVKIGQDQAAAGAGFVAQILKGAEGAKKLVVEAGAQAAFALTGIPPEITGPILDALSAGPEKVREMVREFTKALPEIIKNIILAIPVFVEEFAKAVPEIISALIDAVPEITEALAKSMPAVAAALALQSPKIAIAVIQGIVQNIPKIVEGFAKEFLKIPEQFLKELLKNIPGGSALGGGGGKSGGFSLTGGLDKKVLGIDVPFLAEGGRVPNISQFKGDKFPARLDAGEQVFSGDLSSRLENFLNGNGQGQAQNVTVVLQVGQQELSRVLLDLNRGGFRTA